MHAWNCLLELKNYPHQPLRPEESFSAVVILDELKGFKLPFSFISVEDANSASEEVSIFLSLLNLRGGHKISCSRKYNNRRAAE